MGLTFKSADQVKAITSSMWVGLTQKAGGLSGTQRLVFPELDNSSHFTAFEPTYQLSSAFGLE